MPRSRRARHLTREFSETRHRAFTFDVIQQILKFQPAVGPGNAPGDLLRAGVATTAIRQPTRQKGSFRPSYRPASLSAAVFIALGCLWK